MFWADWILCETSKNIIVHCAHQGFMTHEMYITFKLNGAFDPLEVHAYANDGNQFEKSFLWDTIKACSHYACIHRCVKLIFPVFILHNNWCRKSPICSFIICSYVFFIHYILYINLIHLQYFNMWFKLIWQLCSTWVKILHSHHYLLLQACWWCHNTHMKHSNVKQRAWIAMWTGLNAIVSEP